MKATQFKELLLQSLEHERGGVLVYQTALKCAQNKDLHEEWEKYLDQTEEHVAALTKVCQALKIDPKEMTPGCKVVHNTGKALVDAMQMALGQGNPTAAELVACDCVVLAETKDHANWKLLGLCIDELEGQAASALRSAHDKIEDQEDEHLYHSRGWGRELWLQSLGIEAVLPPAEETQDVKSAVAAARAEKQSQAARKH